MLQGAIKIGIHRGLFCEDNLIYKSIQEIAPGGVTFNTVNI